MISGTFEYIPPGKKKVPTRNLVLRWVNEAWQEIPAEKVMKSFKNCGISNALDRTEDDKLHTEQKQEIDDDEDNKFETENEGKSDADGEYPVLSVKSSLQNGSFRSHQFIYKRSVTNSFNLCLLFIVSYYVLATSWFWNLMTFPSIGFDIREEKIDQTLF